MKQTEIISISMEVKDESFRIFRLGEDTIQDYSIRRYYIQFFDIFSGSESIFFIEFFWDKKDFLLKKEEESADEGIDPEYRDRCVKDSHQISIQYTTSDYIVFLRNEKRISKKL